MQTILQKNWLREYSNPPDESFSKGCCYRSVPTDKVMVHSSKNGSWKTQKRTASAMKIKALKKNTSQKFLEILTIGPGGPGGPEEPSFPGNPWGKEMVRHPSGCYLAFRRGSSNSFQHLRHESCHLLWTTKDALPLNSCGTYSWQVFCVCWRL